MDSKIQVRLFEGPCPDGYIRGRGETPVWGIYCPKPIIFDGFSELTHDPDYPVHVIQHPDPGPAMDWARLHHWQHATT